MIFGVICSSPVTVSWKPPDICTGVHLCMYVCMPVCVLYGIPTVYIPLQDNPNCCGMSEDKAFFALAVKSCLSQSVPHNLVEYFLVQPNPSNPRQMLLFMEFMEVLNLYFVLKRHACQLCMIGALWIIIIIMEKECAIINNV